MTCIILSALILISLSACTAETYRDKLCKFMHTCGSETEE